MKPIHLYASVLLLLIGAGAITAPQRELARVEVACRQAVMEFHKGGIKDRHDGGLERTAIKWCRE